MSIYRPASSKVWWYDFIFEGQRVRESAKTRSKTIAKDAQKARRRELEESYNGIKRRDRAKLFSVGADEWLAVKALTLATPSHPIERDNLKHLRPHFERRLISDIQARDVSRYQQTRLAEGASPKDYQPGSRDAAGYSSTPSSVGRDTAGRSHASNSRRSRSCPDIGRRKSSAIGMPPEPISITLPCSHPSSEYRNEA
jgi:hypothetical protein